MVWGMITSDGECSVRRMEGKQDSDSYIKTIDEPLNKLDNKFGKGNYTFQQDNASIHVSKKSKEYFAKRGTKLMDWPAKSPDLNPMEDTWKMLSDDIYRDRQYKDC